MGGTSKTYRSVTKSKEQKRFICSEAERKEEGTKELAWYGVGERKEEKEENAVKQKWKKINEKERISSRIAIAAATIPTKWKTFI